jgi:hypothetical protein
MSFAFAPALLVSPGAITSPLTLTRAQTGGAVATGQPLDWQIYGADTPRFVLPNGGLLIEGQRTNTFPNPRLEGGTPGAPGTQPTSVSAWITAAGLTVEYVQNVTANGLNGVRYRISGTATGTGTLNLTLAPSQSGYPASPGQTWTGSIFAALAGGGLTNVSNVRLITSARQGTGTAAQVITTISTTLTATPRRYQAVVSNAPGTTTGIMHAVTLAVVAGAVDISLDLFWPQLEQAAFASTPILPPVGTPGAATRGADLVSASLSDLNVGSNGACTVLWGGLLNATTDQQRLFQIDDGSNNNLVTVRMGGGAFTSLIPQRVTGGTSTTGSTFGTVAADTFFSVGMSIDGTGNSSFSNGGAVVTLTGVGTGGFTTLRLGGAAAGLSVMSGGTTRFTVLPYVMSDAELQAAVAAFPSP